MAASTDPYKFPPHYSFPPFFTLQPVAATRASQMASWSAHIQAYCRHARLFQLSLIDALDTDLFWNKKLGKRLALRDAREIVNYMTSAEGGQRAEWVDGEKKKGGEGAEGGGRAWIYWRRPEEWASLIEGWVSACACGSLDDMGTVVVAVARGMRVVDNWSWDGLLTWGCAGRRDGSEEYGSHAV